MDLDGSRWLLELHRTICKRFNLVLTSGPALWNLTLKLPVIQLQSLS